MSVFPKYERYKDSGVEWLEEIPAHWEVEHSKWLFSQRKERCRRDDEQLTASQKYGVIPQSKFIELEGRRVVMVMLNPELLKRVYKGDFVISMRTFQGGIEMSEYDGAVSSAYVPLEPGGEIHSGYFKYLFKTERYIKALGNTSNLIRDGQALRFENFSMVDLPVVPLEEQKRIAAFLDQKTAEIDALIAKKKRQIELLDEQKAILINRAVTRGLNPNAKLKPSGIEWIGDIPEHWEVTRNRRIFSEKSRKITNPDELPLSLSQVDGVIPSKDMKERSLSPAHRDNFKLCLEGDLVLNRFKAHLGVFFTSNYRGVVTFHYGVYEPVCVLNSKYFELLYHTGAYCTIYAGASNGMSVGLQNLSNNNFYEIKTLFPPPSEQDSIVKFSGDVANRVAGVVGSIEKQIVKLKALRNTLIAHAVTGRIKV